MGGFVRATTKWAAFAAALLIGCASSTIAQAQAGKPQKQSAGGKSVCVASALGHRFAMQRIGLMVFGNALQHATVDSWGIDEAAVRRIGQIAGAHGYSVRRVTLPKAAADANASFGNLFDNPVRAQLRALAATTKCSFYITVKPSSRSYNGTNQHLSGLGIVETPGMFDRIFVFASFAVIVYDGSNFQTVKISTPGNSEPGLMAGPSAMYKQVDRSWVPATPQAAAQSVQLRNTSRALVEEGMSKALMGVFEPGLWR